MLGPLWNLAALVVAATAMGIFLAQGDTTWALVEFVFVILNALIVAGNLLANEGR